MSCSTARLERGGGVQGVTVILGLSEGAEVENNTSLQSLVNNSDSPGQVVLRPELLLAAKAMRYQSGFWKCTGHSSLGHVLQSLTDQLLCSSCFCYLLIF